MKPVISYQCEICGSGYDSPEKAMECEKIHRKPETIMKCRKYTRNCFSDFPAVIVVNAGDMLAAYEIKKVGHMEDFADLLD